MTPYVKIGWMVVLNLTVWTAVGFCEDLGAMSLQDLETHIRNSEMVQKSNPDDSMLREQLLLAYQAMSSRLVEEGQMSDAMHYLERADELELVSFSGQTSQSLIQIGMAYLDQDNLFEAKKQFDLGLAKGEFQPKDRRMVAVSLHNVGVEKLREESIDEASKVFENLYSLRAEIVQSLLEDCRSIKVKRLFMFFTDYYGFPWSKKIDTSHIAFGTGKRKITSGYYDPKYKITIPESFRRTSDSAL